MHEALDFQNEVLRKGRGRHVCNNAYKITKKETVTCKSNFLSRVDYETSVLESLFSQPLLLHVPCLCPLPRPRLQTAFDSLEQSARETVMVAKRRQVMSNEKLVVEHKTDRARQL